MEYLRCVTTPAQVNVKAVPRMLDSVTNGHAHGYVQRPGGTTDYPLPDTPTIVL
jgi:hypothetical protein